MCSVPHSAETDSAPAPSDGNRAKPMLLKKCEIFSSLMSPSSQGCNTSYAGPAAGRTPAIG
jgi:hypothetical protein